MGNCASAVTAARRVYTKCNECLQRKGLPHELEGLEQGFLNRLLSKGSNEAPAGGPAAGVGRESVAESAGSSALRACISGDRECYAPPDTRNTEAVTYEASSDNNHMTAFAISRGSPIRPMGTRWTTRAGRSGSPAAA